MIDVLNVIEYITLHIIVVSLLSLKWQKQNGKREQID